MVRKTNLIIAAIIAFAMMALTGCPQADLSNVGATVGIESIDAPVITDQTFDGGIFLSWAPVKDASAYYVYRAENTKKGYKAEQAVAHMPATGDNARNWFVDMPSLNSNDIKNGTKYRYRVVAKSAHQLKSDSEATKTVKAALNPQGSQVAKAENVKVTFENNTVYFTFDKPDYLNAEVKYTFDVDGLEWDGNTIFGTNSAYNWWSDDSYVGSCRINNVPAIGGAKLKYTITTKWGDKYYAENTVEGTVTVPAADVKVPSIKAQRDDSNNLITIQFWDTVGGTYKLYRAVEGEGAYNFTELTDDFTIEPDEQYDCVNSSSYHLYTYNDTNVEKDKSYIYVLTGTVDGKAMAYQEGEDNMFLGGYLSAKAIVDNDDSYYSNFAPKFSVTSIKDDGTVDISFTVQEGWSYRILRCLIDNNDEDVDDESEISVGSIEGKINGVKHVKDTITKSAYGLRYKYTLIAEKNGVKYYRSRNINYAEASVYTRFDELSLSRELLFDGTVDITFSVTPQFTNFKFYRAEVESLYSDKYITEFSDITSSVVYDSSSDWTSYKEYTYKDKTAKADKCYRYDIKATYKGETVDIDGEYYDYDVSTY